MSSAWALSLEHAMLRSWSQRGISARLMLPLTLAFKTLSVIRRLFFRFGIFKISHVDAFVIVVGNVVVGGGGKTPTVISIVQHLSAQGWHVGVVSRGFGRTNAECLEVTNDSVPSEVGDEPALIHRATGVPVFVSRDRHQAAQALLVHYPRTEIIVCDDGLQHFRLYRDLEVCVFDDRGCGNGWLIPAGPLREPWPRQELKEAGQRSDGLLVLHTGSTPAFSGYTAKRSLSPEGLRHNGTTTPLRELCAPGSRPLLAVAGIAQPQNFFSMLRALGLPLAKTLALPDHYEFNNIDELDYKDYQLICTEKDALKLWGKVPDAVAVALIQTAEPGFFSSLDTHISTRLSTTLSLPHGHKTS